LPEEAPATRTFLVSKGIRSVNPIHTLLAKLAHGPAILVTVHATRGSVPRESGAWMAVFDGEVLGTVGGGHLELQSISQARTYLRSGVSVPLQSYRLGPSLGQCCGGEVQLHYEKVATGDGAALSRRLQAPAMPVALFGGGHVGRALIQVFELMPVQVTWVDSRDEIFPARLPPNVVCEHSDPVQAAVARLPSEARVLIMSFSHAEDLDVVAACLMRQRERADLPYVGLIGSRTKWAAFRHRLEARGFTAQELSHITSPIGVPGISSKAPQVIAVAVAAQILQTAN
jgi:xanthine dehydrogenase accessory factor